MRGCLGDLGTQGGPEVRVWIGTIRQWERSGREHERVEGVAVIDGSIFTDIGHKNWDMEHCLVTWDWRPGLRGTRRSRFAAVLRRLRKNPEMRLRKRVYDARVGRGRMSRADAPFWGSR